MNLGTLTTATAQFVNDANLSRYAGFYTGALNLAQQQFAIDTKCIWKDWPATVLVAAQAGYTLPTDFMWEKQVLCNGLPLTPTTRMELARTHGGSRWDTIVGTPTDYNIDPDTNKDQILLFPIPDTNDAGKDLVLTYYALPLDMASSTDIPLNATPLLVQFHLGLAAWAAWYLTQGEDEKPDVVSKKRALISIYNDVVSQAVNTFKNTVSSPIQMRGVRTYSR